MPPPAKKVKCDEPALEVAALKKELSEVRDELKAKCEEVTELQERVQQMERFRVPQNDRDVHFFTGLPTYAVFLCLFRFVEPLLGNLRYRTDVSQRDCASPVSSRTRALNPIDELFLALMKLRLGLLNQDLAYRFNISVASVSRIFRTWIIFLDQQLRPLITWPSHSAIDAVMPPQFKELYPRTRAILDGTEIFIEKPSELNIQSATYSLYKHHNTFKLLIAISPSGAVTFVSSLYPGSISDKELTLRSAILDLFEPGDSLMADKGFDIAYECMTHGVHLNKPPRVRNPQLSRNQVITTRKIASLRIHVERAIGRIKQYNILTHTMPLSLAPLADHICCVCTALTLFHPPLVTDKA